MSDKTLHRVVALLIPAAVRLILYVVMSCLVAPLVVEHLGVKQAVYGSTCVLRAIVGLITTCFVIVLGLLAICASSVSKHIRPKPRRLGYLGCVALLWASACTCALSVLSSAPLSAGGSVSCGPVVEARCVGKYLLQPVNDTCVVGDMMRPVEVNITQMSDKGVGVGLSQLDELWVALDSAAGPLDVVLASSTTFLVAAEVWGLLGSFVDNARSLLLHAVVFLTLGIVWGFCIEWFGR